MIGSANNDQSLSVPLKSSRRHPSNLPENLSRIEITTVNADLKHKLRQRWYASVVYQSDVS